MGGYSEQQQSWSTPHVNNLGSYCQSFPPSSNSDYYQPQMWIPNNPGTYGVIPPKVQRARLKQKGPHGRDEVKANYQFTMMDEVGIESMKQQLNKERVKVRGWAMEQLRTKMLNRAMALNMQLHGNRIMKYKDIKGSWMEDCSIENAARLYEVMFGDYEHKNAAWSKTMERQYMDSQGMEYEPWKEAGKSRLPKGCYERIISKAKTVLVRLLNRDAVYTINMSRPRNTVGSIKTKDEVKVRRKHGDYYIVNVETVGNYNQVRGWEIGFCEIQTNTYTLLLLIAQKEFRKMSAVKVTMNDRNIVPQLPSMLLTPTI